MVVLLVLFIIILISLIVMTILFITKKPKIGGTSGGTSTSGTSGGTTGGTSGDRIYSTQIHWSGSDLIPSPINEWTYYQGGDPTHGIVNYDQHSYLLTQIGSSLKISVGTTILPDGTRDSIRLQSGPTYDYGVFIISVDHIPEGLGVWPAFWLVGEAPWACGGEIDIIEGVNSVDVNSSTNQTTLHTSAPCLQPNGGDCNAADPTTNWSSCGCSGTEKCPTRGCPRYLSSGSFGYSFNRKIPRGGVFACELTKDGGVNIWYFPDSTRLPFSSSDSSINTKLWPNPNIQFEPCSGKFKNMRIIINTALCGDWAGNSYNDGQGRTGSDACAAAIRDPNYTLSEAYWLINWLKVYQ